MSDKAGLAFGIITILLGIGSLVLFLFALKMGTTGVIEEIKKFTVEGREIELARLYIVVTFVLGSILLTSGSYHVDCERKKT